MADYTRRLGYGGSATIEGIQVLVTSGGFERSDTPSTLDMMDIPSVLDGVKSRSRVYHAPGTSTFTGSLTFDVTLAALSLFAPTKLLGRNWEFDVGLHDGTNSYEMTGCLAQSLTLSGSAGGLISATLSFSGVKDKESAYVDNEYLLDYGETPDHRPIAYWWTGAEDVRDWTFTFTQDVSPMYGNTNSMNPNYLRAGLISYSLQTTVYDEELEHSRISVATREFTLTGITTAKGYNYGGQNDFGTHTHTFESAAAFRSDAVIIA